MGWTAAIIHIEKNEQLRDFKGRNLDSIESGTTFETANLLSIQGIRGQICLYFG